MWIESNCEGLINLNHLVDITLDRCPEIDVWSIVGELVTGNVVCLGEYDTAEERDWQYDYLKSELRKSNKLMMIDMNDNVYDEDNKKVVDFSKGINQDGRGRMKLRLAKQSK
jgi:hypothetical protein